MPGSRSSCRLRGSQAPPSPCPSTPPTAREPGLDYLTVAVGRDYADVAPTSGTFRAASGGQLSAQKRLGLTAVEYAAA